MKKNWTAAVMWVLVLAMLGWFGSGGTMPVMAAETVYIATAEQLTAFAIRVNNGETTLNGVLTADIVLQDDISGWAEWGSNPPVKIKKWIPIGTSDHKYAGTFDGAGFTVSGLYINNVTKNGQGLFGIARNGATIKNLGLTQSYIKGPDDVGGIAGAMYGDIINCYNTATISGKDNIGGLAGYIETTSNFSNSYNSGKISGNSYVGGLIGHSRATKGIINGCNTGTISGTANVGGVVGYNIAGTMTNCYYQTGTAASGLGNADDVTSKVAVKTASAFAAGEVLYLLNQYAVQTEYPEDWRYWTQKPGETGVSFTGSSAQVVNKKITLNYQNSQEPRVFYGAENSRIMGLPAVPEGYINTYLTAGMVLSHGAMSDYRFSAIDEVIVTVKQYQLTVDNEGVVEIDTAAELTEFSRYVNDGNTGANAKIITNIELNKEQNDNPATNWEHWGDQTAPEGLVKWIPIGTALNNYAGTFDGANFTISGIFVADGESADQGLFGVTAADSRIKNIKLTESYINGKEYVGGIVGRHYGIISNCNNSANIIGNSYVGGLAGMVNSEDGVSACYNSGMVRGSELAVGGLVGQMVGPINNCYNTGTVSGNDKVGGLVGDHHKANQDNLILNNCFNVGSVSGETDIGRIAGCLEAAIVADNCYYQSETATQGIGNDDETPDQTQSKTAAAFASGEVAWLLQNGQSNPTIPTWGQRLTVGGDAWPTLKDNPRVYRLTLMQGDGSLYEQSFRNPGHTITLDKVAGISWKDALGASFTEINDDSDHTLFPWLTNPPIPVPTATAVYGTRIRDIGISGASIPAGSWSWKLTPEMENLVLPVNHNSTCSARFIANDGPQGIIDVEITPVISARSLTAAEVLISQPTNVNYCGTAIEPEITVVDSGAVITPDDYTVSYTNNISPGLATVTITGQANYQGVVTRNFTIKSPAGGGTSLPQMNGIDVNPQSVSFDPAGYLAVEISGTPPGAMVHYSLDGSYYSITPPAITRTGEQVVFVKVCCPGYQDFITQTTVSVTRQPAPVISPIQIPIQPTHLRQEVDLKPFLPANRGQTGFQMLRIIDPHNWLSATPLISNGIVSVFTAGQALSTQIGTAPMPLTQRLAGGVETRATDKKSVTIEVLVRMENYEDAIITLVVGEAALFEGFLAINCENQYYFYQQDDLNYSYLADQLNPKSASAKMYQHFVNNGCKIVAFKDITKGYLDYQVLMSAYLKAQLADAVFDLDLYCDSNEARLYPEDVSAVSIVKLEGAIETL